MGNVFYLTKGRNIQIKIYVENTVLLKKKKNTAVGTKIAYIVSIKNIRRQQIDFWSIKRY
jgi:hypothetical protein